MQTTVVGSYPKIPNRPRPARLRLAINRRDRGEITSEELASIEDEGTLEGLGEQIAGGGGPSTLATPPRDKHYGSRDKLTLALAQELRQEVQALADAGAPCIQVNEPAIVLDKEEIAAFVQALTLLLEDVRTETAVYTWFGDATGILPALLETPADTIGLDFVWGRDNWEALKGVRSDKKLGFGIVDARNTRLESPEQISEASKRVGAFVTPA